MGGLSIADSPNFGRFPFSLILFPSPRIARIVGLAEHLNKQEQITDSQFRMLFQIVLLFDEIGLQSWSKFNCRLAAKSLENFHLFETKEHLLRALYVLNLSRKPISNEKAMMIELQVMKYFYHNKLDLKEIGLVCMAFHKTQTKFRTPLMEHVAEKLVDEVGNQMNDQLCVSSILKGIFSSEHRLDASLLDRLGDRLQATDAFSSSFLVLTKFLAIRKKYRRYDERLIGTVLDSFAQQDTVRIKELSRLLLNLLFFDVQLNAKQIGKFNEQFEKIKSKNALYRVEYLLSVYALASHGLIRKEEILTIYEAEFIRVLRSKHGEVPFFVMNLNNILKLFGDSNYKDVAFKDRELLKLFNNFESLSKTEVYARFKKFDRYPSKLYLCYQALKDSLEGRVHLVHLMPGCRYPQIVITPKKTILKDYPFPVAVNVGAGLSVVRIPAPDLYCDVESQRLSGYYKMENEMLRKMGFRLFELENNLVSHTTSELKLYLTEQVFDNLDEQKAA